MKSEVIELTSFVMDGRTNTQHFYVPPMASPWQGTKKTWVGGYDNFLNLTSFMQSTEVSIVGYVMQDIQLIRLISFMSCLEFNN